MVIMEKGLLRLMKQAYKRGGYNVVIDNIGAAEYLFLRYSTSWMVGIRLVNVPRKVLALLVEHMGRLPACGEAFDVSKASVQKEIFDVADDPFQDLLQCMDHWEHHKIMKPTKMVWNGDQVWQSPRDQSIVLVDPDRAELAAFYGGHDVRLEGIDLIIKGSLSFAAICKAHVSEGDKPLLEHLTNVKWVE